MTFRIPYKKPAQPQPQHKASADTSNASAWRPTLEEDDDDDDDEYETGTGTTSHRPRQSTLAQRRPLTPLQQPFPPPPPPPPSQVRSDALGFTVDLDREFSSPFRELWSFRHLNHVQSACFPTVYKGDQNVVVGAPTGCGKTQIMELGIVRLIQESASLGESQKNWKIIYLAPTKALCQQRLQDWLPRIGQKFGLKVSELTGDTNVTGSLREIASAQLILTTPEKFDSVSRAWKDHLFLMGTVRLVLVDEVHFLAEDPRGATLEAVIVRMKTVRKSQEVIDRKLPASKMRLIAVSATLPNIKDIGAWLECPPNAIFSFDYTFRPVPLDVHVLGYQPSKNEFLFNKYLEARVQEVIVRYSDRKPTLVFCESKKAAESLAAKLATTAHAFGPAQQHQQQHDQHQGIANPKLRELVNTSAGIAFHHAGLEMSDRNAVETLLQTGRLRVLCSTSTLAVGINTPAHLVIVKGTTYWRGSKTGYEELSVSSILQMIGRAGRPGFNEKGVAVIMTSKDKQGKYEDMSKGQETVESQLLKKLHEALNSEVSSSVIRNIEDALLWLRSTFFFVRVHANPKYYNLEGSKEEVEAKLKTNLLRALGELHDSKMVDLHEDLSVSPLVAGRVMSKTMMVFPTMKTLMSVSPDASLEELLLAVCSCRELETPVRKSEKRILNDLLAKSRFKANIKRCQQPQQKAFILLQAGMASLEVTDFSLRMEQDALIENAIRVTRACREYSVEAGRGAGAYYSLLLERSLRGRMWENEREVLLQQCEGIGENLSKRLAAAGIKTFDDVLKSSAAQIDMAAGRRHPFGIELQQKVGVIQQTLLNMDISQVSSSGDATVISVQLSRADTASAATLQYTHNARRNLCTLVAYASDMEPSLLLFRDINPSNPPASVHFTLKRPTIKKEEKLTDGKLKTTIALISNYIGLDTIACFYADFGSRGSGPPTPIASTSAVSNGARARLSSVTTVGDDSGSSNKGGGERASATQPANRSRRGQGSGGTRGNGGGGGARGSSKAKGKPVRQPPFTFTQPQSQSQLQQAAVSSDSADLEHGQPYASQAPACTPTALPRHRTIDANERGPRASFNEYRFQDTTRSPIFDFDLTAEDSPPTTQEASSPSSGGSGRNTRSTPDSHQASEYSLIQAKAREVQADQVPIRRIAKASAGPLLEHKVTGSSVRAEPSRDSVLTTGSVRRAQLTPAPTSTAATEWHTPPERRSRMFEAVPLSRSDTLDATQQRHGNMPPPLGHARGDPSAAGQGTLLHTLQQSTATKSTPFSSRSQGNTVSPFAFQRPLNLLSVPGAAAPLPAMPSRHLQPSAANLGTEMARGGHSVLFSDVPALLSETAQPQRQPLSQLQLGKRREPSFSHSVRFPHGPSSSTLDDAFDQSIAKKARPSIPQPTNEDVLRRGTVHARAAPQHQPRLHPFVHSSQYQPLPAQHQFCSKQSTAAAAAMSAPACPPRNILPRPPPPSDQTARPSTRRMRSDIADTATVSDNHSPSNTVGGSMLGPCVGDLSFDDAGFF